jgi:hypothetical protein
MGSKGLAIAPYLIFNTGSTTNQTTIKLTATTTLAGNYILTLPTTTPVADLALVTDANGNLRWASPSASISGGTKDYLARWTSGSTLGIGLLMDNGSVAGVNATSAAVSFNVQGSGALNPFRIASSTGAQLLTVTPQGSLVIGATTPTATTTKLFISDNTNNYLEANIKNLSNGTNASSDFVATADNGSDSSYFIDFGINSSGYNSSTLSLQGANDGYLYVSDNKLVISTASTTNSNADIIFSTKGVTPSNERMRITAGGNVGIGTTSPTALLAIQGTSSSPTINLFSVASSTGAQMITVDYQGDFGINSSTPIADLTLVAHAGDSNPLVEVASATGATYLRVNSNGNVGIGTSTINALLGISVINNSDAVWVNTSGTGNLVRLQQGGTDRFLIGNSGSLTISTSDIDIVKTTSGANLVDTDFNRTANATSSA